MDHMNRPRNQGGKSVLNLLNRNEAIHITKLKRILDRLAKRPLASDAAEAIMMASLPKSLQPRESDLPHILDIFMQRPFLRAKYHNRSLPPELCNTLNVGTKYNLRLENPTISLDDELGFLAWAHIGLDDKFPTKDCSRTATCLRKHHDCHRIGDLISQTEIQENAEHKPQDKNCPCTPCQTYRWKGCKNPESCYQTATNLVLS